MAKNKLAKLTTSAPVAMNEPDVKWRAEEALRTISRAEEHRKDKALMKEVKKIAKQQHKAVCK